MTPAQKKVAMFFTIIAGMSTAGHLINDSYSDNTTLVVLSRVGLDLDNPVLSDLDNVTSSQESTLLEDDKTGAPSSSSLIAIAASFLSKVGWSMILASGLLSASVATALAAIWFSLGEATARSILKTTLVWWQGLAHYWWHDRTYNDFPYCKDSVESRVYIRSIALAMSLWSLPHYRNGSFQEDMEKNLRNVAIPGTGLPLSVLCRSKLRFYFAVLFLAPAACLYVAAFVKTKESRGDAIADRFARLLLRPTDWFTLWRINCCLASYHAHVTKSTDFQAEDKWTFLQMAEKKGIPVSPTLELPAIVVKDRNEEGGMGINFFANARHGGSWIIQKVLKNAPFVAELLPDTAPLSTIRIVTASRVGLPSSTGADQSKDLIEPLSCVLRLGRENAMTDHDAILFDASLKTGEIREGTVNKSWYQLGLQHATFAPPAGPARFAAHPDSKVDVQGKHIPGMDDICDIVKRAHFECCPEVPLCGWDVALSDAGTVLLEVNLSCNFFQATIDYDNYFNFVDAQFAALERRQLVSQN